MHSAKVMRRWTIILAYASIASVAIGAVAFSAGLPFIGFALVMTAPVLLFFGMLAGSYSFVRTRCDQCGKRFFSISFPVWPFENSCASCGAHISEA